MKVFLWTPLTLRTRLKEKRGLHTATILQHTDSQVLLRHDTNSSRSCSHFKHLTTKTEIYDASFCSIASLWETSYLIGDHGGSHSRLKLFNATCDTWHTYILLQFDVWYWHDVQLNQWTVRNLTIQCCDWSSNYSVILMFSRFRLIRFLGLRTIGKWA